MRVLQIGAGRWGRNHVRSWQRLGIELRVHDADPEALAGLEAATTPDLDEALEQADAVDIVTPAPTHAPLVREALERGKDVFVEKPLVLDEDEAFELDALARRRHAILQVGHLFRFAPEMRAVTQALRAGQIGRPRYVTGHFTGFKRPRTDGGVAISDAIHWIDLVSWLLDRQPRAVTATLHDCLGRGLDDVALVTLDYGEPLVHLEAGYFVPQSRRDLVVMGTDGAIVCDFFADGAKVQLHRDAHRRNAEGHWDAVSGQRETLAVASQEPLLEELRAFFEACRTRSPSPIAAGGYAGAAAVAVVAACQRSTLEGRRIEVKLPTPIGEENP
jgi:predicted dehydrogenase